jgi:hypothetical protein
MMSQTPTPAQPGTIYKFAQRMFTPATDGSSQTYNVQNGDSQPLTFGIAQQASVNGVSIFQGLLLNATTIKNGQQGSFTPSETVSIFLSSFNNNGMVISQVAGNALTVQLDNQQPVAHIGFNDGQNRFYLMQTGGNPRSLSDVALAPPPDLSPNVKLSS